MNTLNIIGYLMLSIGAYPVLANIGPPINTLLDQICVVFLGLFWPITIPYVFLLCKASKMKKLF